VTEPGLQAELGNQRRGPGRRRLRGADRIATARFTDALLPLAGNVPSVKDLLPYLAGAASAFVVQILIQVYVVPLVETRKRRLERWEKDVLDLGELLSDRVSDAARQAMSQQFFARSADKMVGSPDFDPAFVEQERRKYLIAARETTSSLGDQVNSRAEWLMERVSMYRSSDRVVKFTLTSMRYRLHVIKLSPDEWRELPDEDWDAWWAEQGRLLTELILELRQLTWDRHPLRISSRARLRQVRYRTKRRLAKIRRKPTESKPSAPAKQVETPTP